MSKETAKKLISELQTNEELKAKIEGITDPAELTKKAVEAGYDVTFDDLIEAEKEYKKELATKNDSAAKKISLDDLDAVAGGTHWNGEDAPDGHEMGCNVCYHKYDYSKETGNWCSNSYYCIAGNSCKLEYYCLEAWE